MDEVAIVSEEPTEELLPILNQMSELETQLKEYKKLQEKYDSFKQKVFNAMVEKDIKKFVFNDTQFTVVSATPEKTEIKMEFDVASFKEQHEELYRKYTKPVTKMTKGKASYLRITLPKDKEE